MKNLKYSVFACFFLVSFFVTESCKESHLDVIPALPTEDTYFANVSQMREGIVGVYSKLVYFYNYNKNNFYHDVRLLPDDDLTTSSDDPFEVFSGINASNGKSADYFKYLYQVVGRANSMLDVIQKKGSTIYTDTTLRAANRGELLFLRAFGNFQLWNLYGTAPLVTSRTTEQSDLTPPNSSATQLLDQAITDLTAATTLLQGYDITKWGGDKGRVTQGAAYAMLGKVYLFRGSVNKNNADFLAAALAFSNVKGYSLVDYGDNFNVAKENNAESVFEVQLGDNVQPGNIWLDTDTFSGNGDISGFWGFFNGDFKLFGTPKFVPTAALLANYSKKDGRYSHSLNSDGSQVVKYVEYGNDAVGLANGGNGNNARIIRYADVLLLQAEALVQSGGSTATAIGLLNQVRQRARGAGAFPTDFSTAETDRTKIMKAIIEERRVELAFEEGHRWFDLKRWHLNGILKTVYGKDLSNWDFSSVRQGIDFTFDVTKNLYLPLPASELALNPNLVQNTGY